MQELTRSLASLKWQEDGISQLGDAISSPQRVEFIIQRQSGKSPIGASDCDEFAAYACECITDMVGRRVFEILDGPWIVSILWEGNKKIEGHNVCAWKYTDSARKRIVYGHIGNWNSGIPFLNFNSLEEIAKSVANTNNLLGYAWCDRDLSLCGLKLIK